MVYVSGFSKKYLAVEGFFVVVFFFQKKFYLALQHGKQKAEASFMFPFQGLWGWEEHHTKKQALGPFR